MSADDDEQPVRPRAMIVAAGVLDAIDGHARADAPAECCGLLVGTDDRVSDAIPTRNVASRPTRYEIDPADYFRIMREARAEGQRVIGAYHSHPRTPPVPSPTDLAEGFPDFLYVIATPAPAGPGSDIRGYWFEEGNFRPVRLVLQP